MYEKPPSAEELAAWGLTLDDVAAVIEVWEENEQAFLLFQSLQTQWRVGMAGPYGLDMLVAFHRMDRLKLSPDDYAVLESDLRVMEYAALSAMNSK
jgi:hypothetical protein